MRVYIELSGGPLRGFIYTVMTNGGPNRVRKVWVVWDGMSRAIEVDPADLYREIPVPIWDPKKLERWLDS